MVIVNDSLIVINKMEKCGQGAHVVRKNPIWLSSITSIDGQNHVSMIRGILEEYL